MPPNNGLPALRFHWNEFLGKLMVSAMSLVLNYIMSKLFIFKKKKDEEKEHGAG
jgi:putative flippase GtrA